MRKWEKGWSAGGEIGRGGEGVEEESDLASADMFSSFFHPFVGLSLVQFSRHWAAHASGFRLRCHEASLARHEPKDADPIRGELAITQTTDALE